MVSPFFLILAPIIAAFVLPLIPTDRIKAFVFYATVAASSAVAAILFLSLNSTKDFMLSTTAGFFPPVSIHLLFTDTEGLVLVLILPVFLLSAVLLYNRFKSGGVRNYMVYLTLMAGISGMLMTRDLFNMFVFIEITSISTYALAVMTGEEKCFEAGFKYIIAGGIASILYLIGTSYIYRYTGNLSFDFITAISISGSILGIIGLFFLFIALLIELKSVPVNGWAYDLYEAVPAPLGALLSVASGSAFIVVLYKISGMFPRPFVIAGSTLGIAGFFAANLMALVQKNEKRMLGYSSAGYLGLLLFIVLDPYSFGNEFIRYCGGLFILSHILIKTGLFFAVDADGVKRGGIPAFIPLLLAAAICGLPPFPSFWAKWRLVSMLGFYGHYMSMFTVLAASLFEIIYFFRWAAATSNREESKSALGLSGAFSLILAIAGLAAGVLTVMYFRLMSDTFVLFLAVPALLLLLDFLPGKVKGSIALAITAFFSYVMYPYLRDFGGLPQFSLLFFLLVSGGAVLHLFASMYKSRDSRKGYYPSFMLMLGGLWGILIARSSIEFFCSWEMMALGSYFLVVRTKRGETPSLLYMGFSAAGAFLILSGLAVEPLYPLADGFAHMYSAVLIIAGMLLKLGILGFHVWVPGSYGEADDDATSFLSSTLSKIAVFGLLTVMAMLTVSRAVSPVSAQTLGTVIGWIGAVTAFGATLAAVYQEDIKHLLAYSSIGQIGYIILAAGLMDHSGWTTALYLTVNHFLFKGMLFLAVAGIIYRTDTRLMYRMGGLIKKMPLTFLSALMAIIALSGVPPLSGFGSKWLLYNALLERGWYLQLTVAMFTSTVAFLYLFRLIHAMFLGQPKPEYAHIKEAPVWLLIPQTVLIAALMGFSMFPQLVLKLIQEAVSAYFPMTSAWEGTTLISAYGYWSGTSVMIVTIGIFAVLLIWLFAVMRNSVGVKQFNVVFAAERPYKPSTTHYAYNFFSPYQKALGFLSRPYGFRLWRGLTEGVLAVSSALRRLYSGNGQTYALHIVLFTGIMFLIIIGGYYG